MSKAKEIEERVLAEAEQMIEEGCTVRELAKCFEISKSTAHKDVTLRLQKINRVLYKKVRKVLNLNKAVKHLRGGEATRRKYERSKRGI